MISLAKKDYSADFQLIGNRIVQLKISNDFILVDIDESSTTKKSLSLSHQIVTVDTDDSGKLSGVLTLNVKVKLGRGDKKCNVDLTLEGCFNSDKELSEEKFRSMLEINGLSTLYSISRSILISITSQTFAQGAVVLPMINVLKYVESQREEAKKKEEKRSNK